MLRRCMVATNYVTLKQGATLKQGGDRGNQHTGGKSNNVTDAEIIAGNSRAYSIDRVKRECQPEVDSGNYRNESGRDRKSLHIEAKSGNICNGGFGHKTSKSLEKTAISSDYLNCFPSCMSTVRTRSPALVSWGNCLSRVAQPFLSTDLKFFSKHVHLQRTGHRLGPETAQSPPPSVLLNLPLLIRIDA